METYHCIYYYREEDPEDSVPHGHITSLVKIYFIANSIRFCCRRFANNMQQLIHVISRQWKDLIEDWVLPRN